MLLIEKIAPLMVQQGDVLHNIIIRNEVDKTEVK